MLASFVEVTILPDYAPRWARQVRIEDDASEGIAALRMTPQQTGNSLGAVHLPTGMSDFGQRFFGHFIEAVAASPDVPTGLAVLAAQAEQEAAPVSRRQSAAEVPLGPIAADEAEHEAIRHFDDVDIDQHAGLDGTRWGAVNEDELLAAWSASAPPDMPAKLLVSEKAALHFEQQLAEFYRLRTAHERDFGGTASAESVGSIHRHPVLSNGRSLISLPEEMRDGAYGTARAEDAGTSLHHLPLHAAQLRRRALRTQWLCVQEAYAQSEAEALDEGLRVVTRRAQRCEGGGVALRRMNVRRRQLQRRLIDLELDKTLVRTTPELAMSP